MPTGESLVRAAIDRVWSSGDLTAVSELYVPDFRYHTRGERLDRAAFRERVSAVRTAFPDLAATPRTVVGDGGTFAAHVGLRGTHEARFLGVDPTGRRHEWASMVRYRVADGRVREEEHFTDLLALREQLAGVDSLPGGSTPDE